MSVRAVPIAVLFIVLVATAWQARAETKRTIAGSLQLDYLAVPTEDRGRALTFDGATMELSMRMSVDFNKHASATVKVCFACHGFEAAGAYVDLRARDELSVRVGRFTPSFGSFPQRYDPANHRTSDKPLPYDMGRMLRRTEWNEGILPTPWVDNGIEVGGTHFFEDGRLDYAVYVTSGAKGQTDGVDLDFLLSRSPDLYYVDNNSEPSVGGRFAASYDIDDATTITAGASVMAGRYDPDAHLGYLILGADIVAQLGEVNVRAEYLRRDTEMGLGSDPGMRFKYGPGANGRFDDTFDKHGFYVESEIPIGRVDLLARFDGLLRRGNVLATSPLTDRASLLRYTTGVAVRVAGEVRVKTSVEYYQFSSLADEAAIHLGIATPF